MESNSTLPADALLVSEPASWDRAAASAAVGEVDEPRKVTFGKDTAGFLTELRRRVDNYFARTGKSRNDCWQMYLKSAIILGTCAGGYVLLVFFVQSWWQAVPLVLLLGVSMALIGFNIQHDGGHHAYSRHDWINRVAAMTLDLIGASSYLWRWKHAVYHHTYVNIHGQDTDIEVSSLLRFTPHAKRLRIHRWQHLYLWLLYGLMASRWHLVGDFQDVIAGKIGPHRIPRPRRWDLVVFLGGKVVSLVVLLMIPMLFHPWWIVLGYYLLGSAVVGIVLSVVFQLAHCVEEARFTEPPGDTLRLEAAWAVHQVESTVDFGRDSRLLAWLLGGLNFQIEHHLFPKVCHIHYPALSSIVEQTCQDFGVQYSEHPTFWAGLVSHHRWLKRLGRQDDGNDSNAPPTPSSGRS